MTEEAIHREDYTLKCGVSICPHLMQYIDFQWLDSEGMVMLTNNNVTIETEVTPDQKKISKLTFTPMDFRHEGCYTCKATLQIPNEKPIPYKSKPFCNHVIGKIFCFNFDTTNVTIK